MIAEVVAAVQEAMADGNVRFALGRKERDRHNRAPRVSFIPIGGSIAPTTHVGGDFAFAPGAQAGRQRYTRQLEVAVECWGQTVPQTEQLLHNTLAAMRQALGHSFQPSTETWIHEDEDNAGDVLSGAKIAFNCTIAAPVYDTITPLVDATPTHVGVFEPSEKSPNYGGVGVDYGDPIEYGEAEEVC